MTHRKRVRLRKRTNLARRLWRWSKRMGWLGRYVRFVGTRPNAILNDLAWLESTARIYPSRVTVGLPECRWRRTDD